MLAARHDDDDINHKSELYDQRSKVIFKYLKQNALKNEPSCNRQEFIECWKDIKIGKLERESEKKHQDQSQES